MPNCWKKTVPSFKKAFIDNSYTDSKMLITIYMYNMFMPQEARLYPDHMIDLELLNVSIPE